MSGLIGKPVSRVDGRQKVTGGAKYAAEHNPPGLVHAVLVGSDAASGRIRSLDTTAAERLPGVLAVMTFKNRPAMGQPPNSLFGAGILGESHLPFEDDAILYCGQFVAMVIAEKLEQAKYAATCVRVEYDRAPHAVLIEEAEDSRYQPEQAIGEPLQIQRGEVEQGELESAVHLDATYETAGEHPNPMEPHATVADWSNGELKVYDSTQWVIGTRNVLAGALNLRHDQVRVIAPFVGGMFGSKAATGAHVMLTALASRELNRPVKTVLSREQVMVNVGARSRTIQRFRIGAGRDARSCRWSTTLRRTPPWTTSFRSHAASLPACCTIFRTTVLHMI